MKAETLEKTEMRISPELRNFATLSCGVFGYIENIINSNDIIDAQENYFLARDYISKFENEMIRRTDFSGISNNRLIEYCNLLDFLREKVKQEYEIVEGEFI